MAAALCLSRGVLILLPRGPSARAAPDGTGGGGNGSPGVRDRRSLLRSERSRGSLHAPGACVRRGLFWEREVDSDGVEVEVEDSVEGLGGWMDGWTLVLEVGWIW